MEKDFFKLVNNSVYGKAIKEKINAKNMGIIQKKQKDCFKNFRFIIYSSKIQKLQI